MADINRAGTTLYIKNEVCKKMGTQRQTKKRVQCPYCIETRQESRLPAHIISAHPDKVKNWIETGGRQEVTA
jgi:predicted Zn-ribbon and HTH transcriptional regulator